MTTATSSIRLVSNSSDLNQVIQDLQLNTYEPQKRLDVNESQRGSRFRIVKSTDPNYIINWKESYPEKTPLNTNADTIEFLRRVFENNNIRLIESINNKYELFEFIGRLEDFTLTSDILGDSDVYIKFIVPVVGKKSIAVTNIQIRCNNQIPFLTRNPVNQFINFDNNYQIDMEKVKYQMIHTQTILEKFKYKTFELEDLIEYYSKVYRVDDIMSQRKRIWSDLYSLYCDLTQPNYQGETLLGAFNTLTYYESNKPTTPTSYSRFLKIGQDSRIRFAFNLGRQLISA